LIHLFPSDDSQIDFLLDMYLLLSLTEPEKKEKSTGTLPMLKKENRWMI